MDDWQSKVPLTPANIPADQESFVAVDDVVPVVVGNAIIYLQTPGTIVRDLAFDQQVQGFAGRDLSLYSAHLFDGHEIERLAYQPTPHLDCLGRPLRRHAARADLSHRSGRGLASARHGRRGPL